MDEKKLDPLKEIGYLLDDQRAIQLVENIRNLKKFSSPFAITRGVIFLTSACNMSCYYCNSTSHPMPPWKNEKVIELIKNLAKNGTRHIQWTGGEPSLCPHLPDFIKLSSALGMNNSASTNGASSTQTYMNLANAGLNRFYISLDTLDENEFDRITSSKGYLRTVQNNILALVKFRDEERPIHITINITLNSRRAIELMQDGHKELTALLNWCIESRVDDFKFLPLDEGISSLADADNPPVKNDFIEACASLVPSRYKMFHYRLETLKTGKHGLAQMKMCHCFHSLDDRAFDSCGAYACTIQLREGGLRIYDHNLSEYEKIQQLKKFLLQDRKNDPICTKFCSDLYSRTNERVQKLLQDDYPSILAKINKD